MTDMSDLKKGTKVSIKVGKGTFSGKVIKVATKGLPKVEVQYKNTKGAIVSAFRDPLLVTIL